MRPRTFAFGVGVFLLVVDRCSASCLPVHAVKDKQEDVLFPRCRRRTLDASDVRLIHVVCAGVQRAVRQTPVDLF